MSKLYVKLISSDNEYLTYPVYGLLEIHEIGTTGSVISAGFRPAVDGKLGAACRVSNPQFEYSPTIALIGHNAVADLAARQIDADESRSYLHKIICDQDGEVLEVCNSRDEAEMFCKAHGLRIRTYMTYPDMKKVYAHIYPDIGTKALTAIYAILCNDEASSDAELVTRFENEFGLTNAQAREQVSRRDSALKSLL